MRTHWCGELRPAHAGQRVAVCGWVHRRRDLGGLVFLDLRDREGVVQVVCTPQQPAHAAAQQVRPEYVVRVVGEVVIRPPHTVNPKIATGEVEIRAETLEVLNPSRTPPFEVADGDDVDESVRLRYRYLDLRRERMQRNLRLRHRLAKATRDFLDREGFWEVETPHLIRATPEGARDFLVPSRLHPGKFYVLPQSPQLLKQILMVAGVERYFQLARCFRDEDLRADRQPEFTQIDVEMSFVDRDDVLSLVERLVGYLMREALGVDVPLPFPRLSYRDALLRYGTDKPDLRYGLTIDDVTEVAKAAELRLFREAEAVRCLRIPQAASASRREVEQWVTLAVEAGAPGVLHLALQPDGPKGPLAKHLTDGLLDSMRAATGAREGDLLLFVAAAGDVASAALGKIRQQVGAQRGLAREGTFAYAWVVDFPLLEWDDQEGRYVAVHHPFTAPVDEDVDLLESQPLRVRAKAYDLVLNGVEVAGGSIRIHRRELQERVFRLLGIGPEQAQERFGFLLEAFQYGAPPHGGIAFGFDRLVMVLAGEDTIRDVIAFPKTASAVDLMMGAPSEVDEAQLREVHIAVRKPAAP
ncbi:MAG: aspartate--tRNA ligase [Armatimonadota bacterium]|nr:aspartate--tRNA ligase [Armatimonadota bacterium]MDW8156212.1 aspartate--tRNA ligase [Armatimonadota bacterium]